MSAEKTTDRIVWVDCEMTGLDPTSDALIEVAVIVTDAELNPFDGGIDVIIKPDAQKLANMNDFVRDMHTKSGLLDELAAGITLAEAQQAVMDYIKLWVPQAGKAPLAGNSVGVDKAFLGVNMPDLTGYLHYRIIDVSTLKELAQRWYPSVTQYQPQKATMHRALQDIVESINELRYYRAAIFVPPPGPTAAQAKEIAARIVATSGASANDLY